MPQILTTKGLVDVSTLDRRTIFEERAAEFVIAVEYRQGEELVRRDCHVVLKEPSVAAEGVSASF